MPAERVAAVQDGDAAAPEDVECPQARLDAVERREDVEAPERDVAGAEPRERLRGRQQERLHAGDGAARERQIRRRGPLGAGLLAFSACRSDCTSKTAIVTAAAIRNESTWVRTAVAHRESQVLH